MKQNVEKVSKFSNHWTKINFSKFLSKSSCQWLGFNARVTDIASLLALSLSLCLSISIYLSTYV